MMRRKLRGVLILLASLSTSGICYAQMQLSNPLDVAREELVEIPYPEFLTKARQGDTGSFRLQNTETGVQYPYQLETLGGDQPRNVLVWVQLPASGTIEIEAVPGTPQPVNPAVFARYVPERMDDFAWENDRIAFRVYGPALEGTPGDADGMDVWVKRTDSLIIDTWYASGDYHRDHGQGLDYYSVGHTLGAGDAAPVIDDSVIFPRHYSRYEILDNGPLRTTFVLYYAPWQVQHRMVRASKTIQLDKGAQLNKIRLEYHFEGETPLTVAAGVARRKRGGAVKMDQKAGRFAYWEPETAHGHTGVGLIFPDNAFRVRETPGQYLLTFPVRNDDAVRYYTGAVWDRAGDITTAQAWEAYIQGAQLKIQNPIQITFK